MSQETIFPLLPPHPDGPNQFGALLAQAARATESTDISVPFRTLQLTNASDAAITAANRVLTARLQAMAFHEEHSALVLHHRLQMAMVSRSHTSAHAAHAVHSADHTEF
jgi:hypothetical protein